MSTVAQAYLVPILVALLIGIVAGWWIFRRTRTGAAPGRATDGAEGNALADQAAAAVSDVAGEILGIPAHEELPGAEGPPDDLQTLKGLGPKLASQLNAMGISRFDQLARLTPDQAARIDEGLGAFKGRIARDRIVEQAGYLARGDRAGFEESFGKLGGA
jgi:predicted flap endonuclease-1-like 5' DNA nuclease